MAIMNYSVKVTGQYQNRYTDWCHENNIEGYSIWISTWNNHPYKYLFEFQSEEDALAFRLRWE